MELNQYSKSSNIQLVNQSPACYWIRTFQHAIPVRNIQLVLCLTWTALRRFPLSKRDSKHRWVLVVSRWPSRISSELSSTLSKEQYQLSEHSMQLLIYEILTGNMILQLLQLVDRHVTNSTWLLVLLCSHLGAILHCIKEHHMFGGTFLNFGTN